MKDIQTNTTTRNSNTFNGGSSASPGISTSDAGDDTDATKNPYEQMKRPQLQQRYKERFGKNPHQNLRMKQLMEILLKDDNDKAHAATSTAMNTTANPSHGNGAALEVSEDDNSDDELLDSLQPAKDNEPANPDGNEMEPAEDNEPANLDGNEMESNEERNESSSPAGGNQASKTDEIDYNKMYIKELKAKFKVPTNIRLKADIIAFIERAKTAGPPDESNASRSPKNKEKENQNTSNDISTRPSTRKGGRQY